MRTKQFTFLKRAVMTLSWWRHLEPKDNEACLEKQTETSIKGIDNGQLTIDNSWYDLSGRRLDAKPTTKGVYVNSGRKVVIK